MTDARLRYDPDTQLDTNRKDLDMITDALIEGRDLRKTYGGGKDGSEVVLIEIVGGGHTWPGGPSKVRFLGKTTMNISANDAMWEFFQNHPMK